MYFTQGISILNTFSSFLIWYLELKVRIQFFLVNPLFVVTGVVTVVRISPERCHRNLTEVAVAGISSELPSSKSHRSRSCQNFRQNLAGAVAAFVINWIASRSMDPSPTSKPNPSLTTEPNPSPTTMPSVTGFVASSAGRYVADIIELH